MQGFCGLLFTGILAAGFLIGCGNPDDDLPDCDSVGDACSQLGAMECQEDFTGVRECRLDDTGCAVWTLAAACGPRQVCDNTSAVVSCVCEDASCTEGATFCQDDAVVTCVLDDDGCRYEEVRQDCGETGQACEAAGDGAECTGCVEDRCETDGTRRCADGLDAIEACTRQEDGCLDWQEVESCGETQECVESEGVFECVARCESECDDTDSTRCSESGGVETCTAHDDGCRYWDETDACDDEREYCDDSIDPAGCATCADDCEALDEGRCAEGAIEVCAVNDHGCQAWVEETSCAAMEPARQCYLVEGTPECLEHPPGDGCAALLVVVPPFVASGDNFLHERTDTMVLEGAGCTTRIGSVEAVFAVDLTAGQTVVVRELAGLDTVLSLQAGSCGSEDACVFSADGGEAAGRRYTAEGDGRVYVIVEAFLASPSTRDYEVHIDLSAPEACDDDADNDIDGTADCDDSDCFGLEPCDAAETNCTDDEDNDGDDDVDCDDSDCDDELVCLPARGIFEMYGVDDPVDLAGSSLIFTPVAGEHDGFTWIAEPGLADFPHDPGTGAATATLDLDDNEWQEYAFVRMAGFELYGVTYSSVFVSANGYVTFDVGTSSVAVTERAFFAHPSVAGQRTDLHPGRASSAGDPIVTVDEWDERVVVTYRNIPTYYAFGDPPDPNDFQIVLEADGSIEIHLLNLATSSSIVGVSGGPGDGTYPDETDFVPEAPPGD